MGGGDHIYIYIYIIHTCRHLFCAFICVWFSTAVSLDSRFFVLWGWASAGNLCALAAAATHDHALVRVLSGAAASCVPWKPRRQGGGALEFLFGWENTFLFVWCLLI